MTDSEGLVYLYSAEELVDGYRDGTLSPIEVVDNCIERINELNESVNSVVEILADRARAAAQEAEIRWRAGTARAFEGIPIGVKDVINVRGTVTSAGSNLYRGNVASTDAEVVRRVQEHGAIVLAKEATTEFAIGGPQNPSFGVVRNPWNLDRWTGGSSSGSAASVASRYYPLSIASDAAGSIRMPASWCGVTGLKPTSGAVPRTGVFPLSWTTETVGPIGRTAKDIAKLFLAMKGSDPNDPRSVGESVQGSIDSLETRNSSKKTRIGIPTDDYFAYCDTAVSEGVNLVSEVLENAGFEVVQVSLPSAKYAMEIGYQVLFTEAAVTHAHNGHQLDVCDPVMVKRLSQGVLTSAADYIRALNFRKTLQGEMDAAFREADLILTFSTPGAAPRLGDLTIRIDNEYVPMHEIQSMTGMLCNLAGVPAVAFPTGVDRDGCPISAQLIAPPHRELEARRATAVFQSLTDHHQRIPALLQLRDASNQPT
jgi:aspartyl-tRNA(Asn)/glutamyl-tRNA(Gln) amidotransferase subunit A